MPKILFYRSKCIGCGICQEMRPEVWRMSKKDGKAVLLKGIEKNGICQLDIHQILILGAIDVANACPAGVIKVA